MRLGIPLGEREEIFAAPFSAPFSGFDERGDQKLSFYLEAAAALRKYGESFGKSVRVTLPPECYGTEHSLYVRQSLALLSAGARQLYADYNYHYDLRCFGGFNKRLWPNAKRNLLASQRQGFTFEVVENPSDEQIKEAYGIVCINHKMKGYPVHMKIDEVLATSRIIDMDCFYVRKEGIAVAAAIIYHTSAETVQLIYWGDLPDHRDGRPMNFMSYGIICHYAGKLDSGLRYFDAGPASSDGDPALGLCDFKESLGCFLSPKLTLLI